MHNIFLSVPSRGGIDPDSAWNLLYNLRSEAEALGHRLHGCSLRRMPLDYARNESLVAFMSTICDINLCVDDDVQLLPGGLKLMLEAIESGCDIVSAPCRLRDHRQNAGKTPFNVYPSGSAPFIQNGVRLLECDWTGFGAVMIARKAYEKIWKDAEERAARPACSWCGHKERPFYRSYIMPERQALDLFSSEVVPATEIDKRAPADLNLFQLDDKIFSLRVRRLGLKIHAAIDVRTVHADMIGCFGEEYDKFEEKNVGFGLVDPTGRKIK